MIALAYSRSQQSMRFYVPKRGAAALSLQSKCSALPESPFSRRFSSSISKTCAQTMHAHSPSHKESLQVKLLELCHWTCVTRMSELHVWFTFHLLSSFISMLIFISTYYARRLMIDGSKT